MACALRPEGGFTLSVALSDFRQAAFFKQAISSEPSGIRSAALGPVGDFVSEHYSIEMWI